MLFSSKYFTTALVGTCFFLCTDVYAMRNLDDLNGGSRGTKTRKVSLEDQDERNDHPAGVKQEPFLPKIMDQKYIASKLREINPKKLQLFPKRKLYFREE